MKKLKPSRNPERDIMRVAYPGQPKENRNYVSGYEKLFAEIPKNINSVKRLAIAKITLMSTSFMLFMRNLLRKDVFKDVEDGMFARDILAIEKPKLLKDGYKSGKEMIIAHWGKGFVAPIHGHGVGLMYEQMLKGRVLVNLYRLVGSDRLRIVSSKIYKAGELISAKIIKKDKNIPDNQHYIHNFVVLEPSSSLHFLVQHSPDGRNSNFNVEHFEEFHEIERAQKIQLNHTLKLPVGSVVVVRTASSKDYGDHYNVVTGPNGEHTSISVGVSGLLQKLLLPGEDGIFLPYETTQAKIRSFYGITVEGDKVTFPEA